MIDESLLKSNFVGRDGFRWWIGQVAPEDAQGGQINGEGWGNRRKVRIMGYHPHDLTELPDKDLPWAQCMLPTTTGTGAGNNGTNVKILPGDSVFGFFIDGDNAQLPVIIGAFGKTAEGAVSNQFSFPFKPFTGYTSKIKNDGSNLKRDQTNEGTKETQKSPYHLPTKTTNDKSGGEEISYFSGIGDKVQFASTKPNTAVDKISTELENALKFVQTLKSYKDLSKEYIDEQIEKLCKEISKKIQGISTGIVGGVLNDTYKKMIPSLNSGVEKVYDDVSSKVEQATGSISTAHLAGAAAQTETIPQLKKLQDEIPKLGKCIVKDLFNIIDEMLCALLKNIANLVSCVIDQFLGGLLNAIIGAIELGLNLAMGALGIAKLLQGFDLGSIIRGSSKGIAGVSFIAECGECPSPPDPSVERWMIGSGVISSPDTKLSKLLEVANTAKGIVDGVTGAIDAVEGAIDAVGGAIAGVTGALDIFSSSISGSGTQSALGACYAGPPKSCNPPKLKVFGGGGFGAEVIPIFGSIVSGNVGSLIGAVITNAGSGYISAPFVEVTDNCNQGYGGIVQTTINTTGPLAGQVASVVVISDGENYPVGTQDPDVFTIVSVLIENPGVEYEPDDIVIDNLGNEYSVVINNGSIVKVDPINVKNIEELPVLEVVGKKNSIGISEVTQGRGAILRPIFGIKPEFQGEVQQIIDCVYPKSSETPLITPTPTTTPITTLTSTLTTTSTST
jgi:hypothetical protein